MKKKTWTICCGVLLIFVVCLIAYPHIEIISDGRLVIFSYTDRFPEFDKNTTLNECYSYNEERDISIYNFDQRHFLFFRVLIMEFVPGDMRQTEFLLEEAYIEHFLQNAQIKHNEKNIDLASLIAGREAVVGNTRYLGNDYETAIWYELDGKHDVMYVFYVDDLLVIQVGLSDEGPKYIAYQ